MRRLYCERVPEGTASPTPSVLAVQCDICQHGLYLVIIMQSLSATKSLEQHIGSTLVGEGITLACGGVSRRGLQAGRGGQQNSPGAAPVPHARPSLLGVGLRLGHLQRGHQPLILQHRQPTLPGFLHHLQERLDCHPLQGARHLISRFPERKDQGLHASPWHFIMRDVVRARVWIAALWSAVLMAWRLPEACRGCWY